MGNCCAPLPSAAHLMIRCITSQPHCSAPCVAEASITAACTIRGDRQPAAKCALSLALLSAPNASILLSLKR